MIRTKNHLGVEKKVIDRLATAWSTPIDHPDDSLPTVERTGADDSLAGTSLLCANIQADVGQPTPFGDLADLLQALYALTTAVATAETRPARTR